MVNLQFIIDDRSNRLDLLKQGQADVVILYPFQVPNELDSKMIRPDEYYLVGHPKLKNRDLIEIIKSERLFAFHPEDQTSLNYLKTFNLLKHVKNPRLYANENLALTRLMQYGVGYGILSKEISEPFISNKTLVLLNQGKIMKDPLAVAWYPRHEMTPYFRDLLAAIN